ncbi:MAG: putative S-adenosylmethionine:tRNA ribosyltransferase-isomerase [Myxococcaceae bacterium]|nr:putative S-adenosylmethionine:tRNA ribosyltransferase-isomerase [Myxococcaceae bacterium]
MSRAAATRLMLIDTRHQQLAEVEISSLPSLLGPRDLLVVNDAATLPASLSARTASGECVEVRLLEGPYSSLTRAVLFGAGDYRTPTELRAAPPRLTRGDTLWIGGSALRIESVSSLSPRLVELSWLGDAPARFALLYRAGRPVQYSYIDAPLALWDVQTSFASRPWAVEMPSAARPLSGAVLLALQKRGIPLASLTHAAGLSATGDEALDAALPLPERYDIPRATVDAVERTLDAGGRVVAVGTSVVRALEDSARRTGRVVSGEQTAELVLDHDTRPRVASGLLTGIHVPGESHFRLLSAFARADTLNRAAALAEAKHYRVHEFGDAALFLPGLLSAVRSAA